MYNFQTLYIEFVQDKLDWKYFRKGLMSRGKLYFTEHQSVLTPVRTPV